MFKIIIFVLLFTLVSCNDTPTKLSKGDISHDVELKVTTKGWYLDNSFLKQLSQVKESSLLSTKTNLLIVNCYNVSYEKVVSTLELLKELKIDTFSIITEQSTSICG